MSPLNFIDEIDKRFNKGIYQLVEEKKNNIEVLVEKSIAFVPWLLFKTYSALESKDNLNKFCICINYASRLFPNKRFHIHTDAGEVKTFCWNNNAYSEFNFQDVSSNYDLTSPFVGLLDLFYRINEIKTGGQDNFSMNKYLESRTGIKRQDIVCIDDSKYKNDVLEYLRNNYEVENVNYYRYSAYLWIATGDIQGNPLLQKDPNSETDKLLLEVLELMASNNTVLPNWTTFKGNDSYIQYNIPIFGFDNDVVKVVCNIVIPSLIKFPKETLSAISLLSNLWISKIWDYENNAWANANAVRASIAQVMARNMSHNFGSHVLSNLVGDGVYEKLDDESVKKLTSFNSEETDEVYKDLYKASDKNHQLQFFFQYLKSRMDYLSEVTFGVSNLLTTKMMNNEVIKELDQVRILLNYISGVSNFNYRFELIVVDEKGVAKKVTTENDIAVAFPSDVLGCQAFYNIIENIIRNTAKHAKNNNGETVTFTITIKDNFAKEAGCEDIEGVDELYCVEIDNGVTEDNIDELVNGKKDKSGKIIIKGQNNRLNDSVLEGQNLRSSSLGLLEMEASAAFLRQIDLPEIESDDYTVDLNDKYYHVDSKGKKRLNILKAFAVKKNEKDIEGHLGYRFFMQKPKEFLFVGNWDVDDMTKKKLFNRGLQFIKADKFCEAMKAEKAFAHQFLIYQQEGISHEVEEFLSKDNDCKTLLPLRKLSISDQEWKDISKLWTQVVQQNNSEKQGNKIIGNETLLQLKNWAWKKYAGNVKKGLTVDDICIKGERQRSYKYQVIFIDHGKGYNKKTNSNGKDYLTNPIWKYICNYNDEKEQPYYPSIEEGWIENMSSRTNGKLPRFEALSKSGGSNKAIQNYIENLGRSVEEENKYLRIELFEAYHNKVVVIDERVQKFAAENFEGDRGLISCADLHRSTNVFIPKLPPKNSLVGSKDSDMIPLDPNDFGEYVEKVEDYINNNIKDSFLLIHYGILERMYGRNETNITDKLKEWAADAKRVVVTSGRGAHSLNLPKSVCFVNLSSALYAFNENRNKYLINYLLNQSRRKRNE